jgi:Uncharacterised protein family (UPF0158)
MTLSVKLSDVVEAFEEVGDGTFQYLDKRTGEIIFLTEDDMAAAEEDELISEFPDWQRESILKAREVLNSDDFLKLPERFEFDEYEMMEEFCVSLEDRRTGEQLLRLIKGEGAFRRFKDSINAMGIEKQWYAHREEAFRDLAIQWLQENGISYKNDDEIEASSKTM